MISQLESICETRIWDKCFNERTRVRLCWKVTLLVSFQNFWQEMSPVLCFKSPSCLARILEDYFLKKINCFQMKWKAYPLVVWQRGKWAGADVIRGPFIVPWTGHLKPPPSNQFEAPVFWGASQEALEVKSLPPHAGDLRDTVSSLGREDPLEKGMATHSSILAWRIPWTEEPGGLPSMGSQRVRNDWSDLVRMYSRFVCLLFQVLKAKVFLRRGKSWGW